MYRLVVRGLAEKIDEWDVVGYPEVLLLMDVMPHFFFLGGGQALRENINSLYLCAYIHVF